jgi:hypothetical protein
VKKNWLKFWKNLADSIRFRFYKLKTEPNQTQTEKTEPNWRKQSQTSLNRFFLKNWTESKPVGLNWFRFFFKIWFGYFSFIKTKPNRKWSPLIIIFCLFLFFSWFFKLFLKKNIKYIFFRYYFIVLMCQY